MSIARVLCALASCSLVASCEADDSMCETRACHLLTIDDQGAHSTSSVTWSGEEMGIIFGDSESSLRPPRGLCYARIGHYPGSTFELVSASEWELFITLHCVSHNGAEELGFGAIIGDLAMPTEDSTNVELSGWVERASDSIDYFDRTGTLLVEDSTGTVTAPPELVSSDYERVVKFELDDAPIPDLVVMLRFTISAAAFHSDPDAQCTECSGG